MSFLIDPANNYRDFIEGLKAARSQQKEDDLLYETQQMLKYNLKSKNISDSQWKEYLIRSIYLHMLGYDVSFIHLNAIHLTESKSVNLKVLAYLACSLFIDPNSEFVFLLVATFQKDLKSNLSLKPLFALNAISKVASEYIIQHLIGDIFHLCQQCKFEIVRKKAMSVVNVFYRISPNLIKDIDKYMQIGLNDKDPSVNAVAITFLHDYAKRDALQAKKHIPTLMKIMKTLISTVYPSELRYSGMNLPWTQITALRTFALLCQNDVENSESVGRILESILLKSNRQFSLMIYAIVYQCVKTISQVCHNDFILETAAKAVQTMFAKAKELDNINLKYMGLRALHALMDVDVKYVQAHQLTIVECLESHEDVLKRESVSMLYYIANKNNIKVIIEKFVQQLKLTNDKFFQRELSLKLLSICEKSIDNFEIYFKTINDILTFGDEFIAPNIVSQIIRKIQDNFNHDKNVIGELVVSAYKEILKQKLIPDNLCKIAVWSLTEIAIVIYSEEFDKLTEIIHILCDLCEKNFDEEITKCWIFTALHKFKSVKDLPVVPKINSKLQKFSASKHLMISEVAYEYLASSSIAKVSELVDSIDIQVDTDKTNFDFLDKFTKEQSNSGAKPYNHHYAIKKLLAKSKINFKLNVGSYEGKKVNDTKLIVSKSKWTPEGYVQGSNLEKQNSKEINSAHSTGISSSTYIDEAVSISLSIPLTKDILEAYMISSVKQPTVQNHENGHVENENLQESLMLSVSDCRNLVENALYYGKFIVQNSMVNEVEKLKSILQELELDIVSAIGNEVLCAYSKDKQSAIMFFLIVKDDLHVDVKCNNNATIRKAFSIVFSKVHSLHRSLY